MLSSVDLPEPDGPITATNSPASTSTLTPRSPSPSTPPIRSVFVTSVISMSGALMAMSSRRPSGRLEQALLLAAAFTPDDGVGDELVTFAQRAVPDLDL